MSTKAISATPGSPPAATASPEEHQHQHQHQPQPPHAATDATDATNTNTSNTAAKAGTQHESDSTPVMKADSAPADQIQCANPTFLHSPPDSNNAAKSEGSDSELSDLDDDAVEPVELPSGKPQKEVQEAPKEEAKPESEAVDDIGEIEPDYIENGVPVFKPTMHQFKDFKIYMEKVNGYGMRSGIIKIISPQEWRDSLPDLAEHVKTVRVREPIKQEIIGSGGAYRQLNMLHPRSFNLPAWRKLCDQSEHQPPARRGERRAAVEKPKPAPKPKAPAAPKLTAAGVPPKKRGRKKKKGRGRKKAELEDDDDDIAESVAADEEDRPMTPVSPKAKEQDADVKQEDVTQSIENEPGNDNDVMEVEEETPAPRGTRSGRGRGRPSRGGRGGAQTVSARRKNARREGSAQIDEKAFEGFDYHMDVSDFTPERCEELERNYWKTLTYAPPLYGADTLGTLFDESTKTWNLNHLPNLLDVLGTKVPGVNTAYLYFGMWKATFAWHLEDVDLYSINYLHFGAPKQWYSISQADAPRFEAAMKNTWADDAKGCSQFLRHKGYLLSPQHLKSRYNIQVNKCVSYPGEFVVTYPYGYHSGYNLGYNCAEAVNFALDSWLPMGKIAKKCECSQAQDSVWVDVYDIERKLRGEETEYEETEEEEDDDEEDESDEEDNDVSGLPTPSKNNTRIKIKAPARKRKRDAKDVGDKKKKVKKVRVRIKARADPPCCLCPNDIPSFELLPTEDGRKAHRMCALYLPETSVEDIDGKETVVDTDKISKDRSDLKCLYCRSKRGACFQCSHKKCARAYHASCAAAAGVFVEEAEVPVFSEDGTEFKEQAFEFSCRFHRVRRDKKLNGTALEDDGIITKAAAALKPGEICQIQYYRSDIFAGIVVENHEDEQTLLLDVIPNGDRVEVEYKWLLLPDATDYRLPKASAKAIPMPTSRKAKDELNAKRTAEDLPRKDDVFVDGFTWAEFHTCPPVANQSQVKLDLDQDNKVWYYLGTKSTPAKPQYTESPALPRHNPRSNFMSTIPKPPSKPAPAPKPVIAHQLYVQPVASTMPQPYTMAQPVSAAPVVSVAKNDKPYVYKPRKPVQPNWGHHGQFYTTQQFIPPQSTSPVPVGGQQSSFRVEPQQQSTVPNAVSTRVVHQQQVRGAAPAQPQQHQPYMSTSQQQPVQQQFYHYQQSANTGQKNKAHASASFSNAPAPKKKSTATPAPTEPTIYQKYHFFQVNHNRPSSDYRTPYDCLYGGGFVNGYQGNFKAHIQQAASWDLQNYRRLSHGSPSNTQAPPASNSLSTSSKQSYISQSANHSVQQGGSPTAQATCTPLANDPHSPAMQGTFGVSSYVQPGQMSPYNSQAWNAPRPSTYVSTANFQQVQAGQQSAAMSTATGATAPGLPPSRPEAPNLESQSSPASSSKQTAPKVQYKIPEKVTPVPLPPSYLAAKKRTSIASSTAAGPPTPGQGSPAPTSGASNSSPKTATPVPMNTGVSINGAVPSSAAPASSSTPKQEPGSSSLRQTSAQTASHQNLNAGAPSGSPPSNQSTSRAAAVSQTPVPLPQIPGWASRGSATSPSTASSSSITSVQTPQTAEPAVLVDEEPAQLPKTLERSQPKGPIGLPDLSGDSMELVEELMTNLRRASSSHSEAL